MVSEKLMRKQSARGRGSFSRGGRGSKKCHRDEMTAGVRERKIAEIKAQLQVLEEWLQEQESQKGKWIFPLKGKRMIWRQLQRRLRQILIALLKKRLRVLAPEMKFKDSTCRSDQRKVLKEAIKTKKSCSFKTDKLCVFAGAEEEIIDNFLSYWVDPDQLDNVNSCVCIADNCDVITGFTEEEVQSCETDTVQEKILMDAKEVNHSVARISEETVETVELGDFVQTESLCMNADDNMLQRCYREIALLEHWLENPEYDREIAEERVQCSEQEGKVADEITGDKRGNVAEGQEDWEAATSIVTAETTLIAAEEALMPYIFYSNNCFVSTGLIENAGENLLDKEIELMRRMMMEVSWKRPATIKQKGSSKRRTAEDCESAASGARQHKMWKPGGRQQTIAHDNLQNKVWDPSIHRSEHMIRRS